MRLLLTVTPSTVPAADGTGPVASSPLRLDVLVDADPGSTVRRLAETVDPMVRTLPRTPGRDVALYLGDRPVDPDASLADAGLLDGSVVGVGGPAPAAGEPPGVVEVRVVSGPDAGRIVRLDPGDYVVGDDEAAVLPVNADGHWARIRVVPDGSVSFLGASGGDGCALEGEPVAEDGAWPQGEQLTLGGTLFEAWPNHRADAAVAPAEDGTGLDYNRPPRLHPAPTKTSFKLPSPPEPPDRPIVQLIMMILLPITMAVGSALVMGRPQYLLIGLLAPVSVLFTQMLQRRTTKARYDRQLTEYEEKKERITRDARDALLVEQRRLRDTCPDPAAVLLLATGPRSRLWERRQTDEDFSLLRVGTGSLPSKVVLSDPTRDDHRRDITWDMTDVPVGVSVKDNGVVGVAGRGEGGRALERWLVAQLAALHSPAELQIHLLSMEGDHDRWKWTRHLPHLRGDHPHLSLNRVGIDATTCARRISELLALLEARKQARRDLADQPAVVIVLDGARRIRSLPGVVQLLREGPEAGIYTLCLDAEERLLPEECQAVVTITPHGMRLRRTSFDNVEDVRPDVPSAAWAERLGRALAPLRDSSVGEAGGTLPRSARLLDVIGLEPPSGEAIAAHWAGGGRSTAATLGVGLDGAFSVDIRRDGPHALIAGTTGSGKSELLQTLVASLAAVNRPESMSFVLVDYKGGSAFKDCVDLPHTVGMVTDLDTHLVGRALVSLGAELHRREHILARAGAKDIEDYLELLDRDPRMPQMPRLMLVIDEFASMARELPDFVKGLVNIAQRGRSLGIHLVLATQRPGGVVTNDIRANTNLRIALRMTDESESRDVIDAPDSAHIGIDTPGRAHVRLGHASLLPFQSGRVGGRRVVASTEAADPEVHPVKWSDLAQPAPVARRGGEERTGDVEVTDLTVLVAAVGEAAQRTGAERQPSPWLPALPVRLTLGELLGGGPPAADPGTVRAVPLGLVDVPARQRQHPYTFDPARTGHLHVMGSGRSGRSQALRTLAASLALGHHPGDLHMYGLDCGNGALLPLERFPHCGAVAQRGQAERVVRLVAQLEEELDRRQKLLAAHGCADLEELRARPGTAPADRPAHLVLFIDRIDVFEQTFGEYNYGALVEGVATLMRDGAGVGIHVVAAGDRILTRTKYSSTTEELLVLRCNDPGDYSTAGLNARSLPEEVPDGRAFRAGDALEVQIALLNRNPQGGAQAEELGRIADFVTRRTERTPAQGPRPFRVDVLPDRLTYDDTARYRRTAAGPLEVLVGVGGNELSAVTADLASVPTFLIAGPPRSGRSSMIAMMARSLLESGTELLLVTPRGSRLTDLRGHPGVRAVLDSAEPRLSQLHEALGRFEGETAAVLIDDAELLLQSDLGKEFTRIARGMVGPGWGIVAAGTNDALQGGFNGWHVHLKRNRVGALLSPQAQSDAEVLGLRLPKGVAGPRIVPGIAHLHLGDGQVRQVRVPLP
ncbi:DNA segregation ATPase FtsK/SpoIIIE, S-DNA-T family [Nocardiopsis flavescens]|uniref:DNA segregation ATPase FtsK/SpoIIIE, S-DNA-T family n=1 Tax=Nocardiopsis flavescens TaxID=758803 RepID=A0A1M6N2K1_9ACTN|nr:FtsK/SpoIIIE domain-containing protein [Nocardiopsis flavescens]SHJ89959.1 DNA segregation ATPase FtsK/SpoIIIE, S-DNA-T family [Nocardiopsis flavescens]